MKIKCYVKDGYIAFECEGVFVEPLRQIVLDRDARVFKAVFDLTETEAALDCVVDDGILDAIHDHNLCGLGFYYDGRMVRSALVPFAQTGGETRAAKTGGAERWER